MLTSSLHTLSSRAARFAQLPRWAAGLAALGAQALGGCALETRPGDGLYTDGREIQVQAVVAADAGSADAAMVRPPDMGGGGGGNEVACKNVALFKQKVVPHFISKCIECHDGTKPKALAALDMSSLKTDDAYSCVVTLILGAEDPDKNKAEILTSSDPSRPDVKHDFKYKTLDEFDLYRADVLTWLSTEK